jgi:hypothetical protein
MQKMHGLVLKGNKAMELPGKQADPLNHDELRFRARQIANSAKAAIGKGPVGVVCPICARASNSPNSLTRHIILNHQSSLHGGGKNAA